MIQIKKELLLSDLYARLPYGFIVHRYSDNVDIKINTIDDFSHFLLEYSSGEKFMPYLRPMSSITEEEKRHISKMMCLRTYDDGVVHDMTYPVYTSYYVMEDCLSYLRSIHVDYSGLIEKGLALEAPEGMYKLKEK